MEIIECFVLKIGLHVILKNVFLELPIDGCIYAIVLKVKYLGTKGVLCFFT
jgi:hypothetical protein